MKFIGIKSVVLVCGVVGAGSAFSADLTYPEIVKIIGSNKSVKNKLVGQTASVQLKSTGPDSLMVNAKDMTFFTCDVRDASFKKGGKVSSRITNYSEDEDGNPVISLAKCAL